MHAWWNLMKMKCPWYFKRYLNVWCYLGRCGLDHGVVLPPSAPLQSSVRVVLSLCSTLQSPACGAILLRVTAVSSVLCYSRVHRCSLQCYCCTLHSSLQRVVLSFFVSPQSPVCDVIAGCTAAVSGVIAVFSIAVSSVYGIIAACDTADSILVLLLCVASQSLVCVVLRLRCSFKSTVSVPCASVFFNVWRCQHVCSGDTCYSSENRATSVHAVAVPRFGSTLTWLLATVTFVWQWRTKAAYLH